MNEFKPKVVRLKIFLQNVDLFTLVAKWQIRVTK